MDELNKKQLQTLEFMARYGSLEFFITDNFSIVYKTKESLAPASKRD